MPIKWRLDPGQIEVVDEALAEVYRRMTPEQLIGVALSANRTARKMLYTSIQTAHIDWSDAQIKAEVARRMLHGTI